MSNRQGAWKGCLWQWNSFHLMVRVLPVSETLGTEAQQQDFAPGSLR